MDKLIEFLEKLKNFYQKVKYQMKMLPHRPRLWWHKLWIRKDEFDKSLDMDMHAMMDMDEEDQKKYTEDLVRRRNAAHQRDLDKDK